MLKIKDMAALLFPDLNMPKTISYFIQTEMRNTMLLSLALFAIAWSLFQPLGNHGLWLAFMVFMSARGISLGIVYKRLDAQARFI